MKIALINENSQAAKNGIIEAALKKVVEPMGHEVVNYGMYTAEDAAQLTYVQCGILAAILLNSGAADYVITGCGTGEGAMLALNIQIICLSQQFLKRLRKSLVILFCPLPRPFDMIPARCPSRFFVQMPLHKHLIDILICIPLSRLVYRKCTFSQCHRSHAIILSNNYITSMANAYQLVIHRIRSGTDYYNLTVIRCEDMVRIA